MDEEFQILIGTKTDTSEIKNTLKNLKDLSVNVSRVTLGNSAIDDIKKQLKNNNITLNVDLGNTNGIQRQAQNLGQNIGSVISKATQSTLEGVMSNSIGKYFKIDKSDSNAFAKEANKLVADWTKNKGKVNSVQLTTKTVYDKDAEADITALKQAVISYQNEVGEAIQKTVAWRQIGTSIDNKGQERAIMGFAEVASKYSKTLGEATKQTDNFVDKQKQAISKSRTAIKQINSSALKSSKPIQQEENLEQYREQIIKVYQALNGLKGANSSTFTDAKIKVDEEIATLKRLVTEFQNTEYAATSLRAKDISTIKKDELHNLDAFVAKMEQSGHATGELRKRAEELKVQLNAVGDNDQEGLTAYLNKFSNLKSEFNKVETEARSAEKALNIKAKIDLEKNNLETLKQDLQESGNWTDDIEKKWNSLTSTLGHVKTDSGLSTWKTELKSFSNEIDRVVDKTSFLANGNQLINSHEYDKQIASISAGFRMLGEDTATVKNRLHEAENAYEAYKAAIKDKDVEKAAQAQQNFDNQITQLKNDLAIAKYNGQEYVKYLDSAAKTQLGNQIERWLQQNTAATKDARTEMQGFLETVRNGDVTTEQAKQIRARMGQITNDMRAMGRLGVSTFGTLRKDIGKFTQWIGASRVVMKVFQELKEGIQLVKDLDAAMTNINYTMNVSSKQLDNVANSSVKMAKDLNTTTSNVLGAVTLYANANETAESILEKAKSTVMLSNVTGMGTEDAANVLQGAMRQFDLAEEDLMHISDVLQSVSAAMPYDFTKGVKELAEGIEAAGTVAKESGYDLERYSSLLGVLIANTRQSGSELSRALRTMMQRTTKVSTSAIKTGDITEDDVSNAEKALRRVGIEIRPTVDTFKDFDEIMLELYEHIDKLSEADLNNLAYELAGIRQGNVFRTMIKSYGEYQAMVEKAYDSDGKTLENQEKYAKSIKGRLTELQAVGESFWTHFLDSDTLKFGISSLTTMLKLLEGMSNILSVGNWNSFGTFATGLGAYLGARNIGKGKSSFLLNMPIFTSVSLGY